MSKKPIKSSLFRFVTLRSPQVPEDMDVSFVSFDPNNESSSTYYQAIDGAADNTARQQALESADPASALISSRSSLKGLHTDLYTFSTWLAKNKNKLTFSAVVDKIPTNYLDGSSTSFVLSTSEEVQIWDNLFYQTVQKESVSLRESFIQMLIANQFAKAFQPYYTTRSGEEGEIAFTKEAEKEFKKRACASVIIDKSLILSSDAENVSLSDTIPPASQTALQNELENVIIRDRINTLNNALIELEREEIVYEQENQLELDAYITQRNNTIDTNLTNATPTLVDYVDPETQVTKQVETYPDLEIPEFDYQPLDIDFQSTTDVFSKSTTSESNLSDASKQLFKEVEFESYNDFSTLKNAIREKVSKEEEALIESTHSTSKAQINQNNAISSGTYHNIEDYCFSGEFTRTLVIAVGSYEGQYNIYLNIATNRDNSSASNILYTLTRDYNGTVFNGTNPEFISNSNKRLVYKLPIPMTNSDFNQGTYTFNAGMTFENGDDVTFTARISVSKLDGVISLYMMKFLFSGCGVLQNGVPDPDPDPTPTITNSLNGIMNLGVGDFRRVEQEVCCYVPGEVSHIENIMKGESKERNNRTLKRTENTFTLETERTTEQLRDTTSTDRYEMNQETSQVVTQDSSFDLGVTLNTSGLNTSLSVNSNYATATSTTESNSQAVSYAKDVTERALERITERVREERVSRIIQEYEEENKHSLDNSTGTTHSVGLYRWVDKVYKNQVVNYGKRLMYEFNIPQPAAYYLKRKADEDGSPENNLIAPADPRALRLPNGELNPKRIETHKSLNLTQDKYSYWAARYNVALDVPPTNILKLSEKYLDKIWGDNGQYQKAGEHSIDIPEGYYVKRVSGYFDPRHGNHSATFGNMEATILIGGQKIDIGARTKFKLINLDLSSKKISEKLELSLTSWDIGFYNFNFTIECELLDSTLETWQMKTFNKIVQAYLDAKAQYDIALQEFEVQNSNNSLFTIDGSNPLYYRQIEQTELKKNCIYMMAGKDAIGKDFVTTSTYDEIVPNNNASYGKYASFVNFMEQSFDWKLMTYIFRPYFWADKEKWEDLFQLEDDDAIFRAFLRAGIAKVVVPVRLGFEKAVMHYLATGELWDGGDTPIIDDELYISIADELQEQEGIVEGECWETRVPTSLTILQAKNAAISGDGLLCFCDDYEAEGMACGVDYDTVGEDNTVT